MLTHPKTLSKIAKVLNQYPPLRFAKIGSVPMEFAETREHFRAEPKNLAWRPIEPGTAWGGSGITGWFRGDFTVPAEAVGKPLFLRHDFAFDPFPLIIEGLMIIDGEYKGTLNPKHMEVLAFPKAKKGGRHHVAIESYCGHSYPSTQPHDKPVVVKDNACVFHGVDLVLEREDVSQFIYDLQVLLKLIDVLDPNSLRRGELVRTAQEVWAAIHSLPAEVPEEEWRPALADARRIMAPVLAKENGPTAPIINVVAHSHLDTAWLWTIAETRRKCARTFSSMVNLMQRFPEVIFMQSAPCHADFVRQDYPSLFEAMKKLVKSGRWEPNGGAWIEPDCNLTGGEALIRQFLHGIRWTRKHFGYSSDTLWQPDVFGYSAALPQILKGCGIDYFCTTKMAWNDTTRFPYDTFEWKGLDGTMVLTHLNSLPQWFESDEIVKQWNWAQHKDSEERRLASYGWGDGGGGPTAEDMERVRRMKNLEGAPRVEYTTVSKFMKTIEATDRPWPVWVGELYLELHRGTLTSMAAIKRGNRKTELQLRDAEITNTAAALAGATYPKDRFETVWKKLLINQFHDILPGTSIAEANEVALKDFAELQEESLDLMRSGLAALTKPGKRKTHITLFNTLSWERSGIMELSGIPAGLAPIGEDIVTQEYENLLAERVLMVSGPKLPPLGSAVYELGPAVSGPRPPFKFKGHEVQTPHGTVLFNEHGGIASYRLTDGREVVAEGAALNTLMLGEDVPDTWDNWDIDPDQYRKMKPVTTLVSRNLVANGPLELRIRFIYTVGRASTLRQDVVFRADSPAIHFETHIDWQETHALLKASFPVDVHADFARHEIQFGHAERPTHSNQPQDRARFEVCCHRWSDLSDNGFGVAILNDCKYGISVRGNVMQLTLIKSGTHPDPSADRGDHHRFTYSMLPHEGTFSVPTVLRPAHELNTPVAWLPVDKSAKPQPSLVSVSAPNVLVEAIKIAEDGEDVIVRLYEAGRMKSRTKVALPFARKVFRSNMLEEAQEELKLVKGEVTLTLRPFEIVTLRVQR